MARVFAFVWLAALLVACLAVALTGGRTTYHWPQDFRPGSEACTRFGFVTECQP